jgi:dienelactone hydrolase
MIADTEHGGCAYGHHAALRIFINGPPHLYFYRRKRREIQMNAAAVELRTMEVRISCPGAVLAGDLAQPDDARGLVIFAHGSGSSRGSPRNRWVAEQLNERRLATLLFDLLTPAEARAEELGGELRFDIPFLTDRLVAATEWARRQPLLGSLGIGYFGASTGAAAALAAAAHGGIQAVVSRGGRTDLAGNSVSDVKAATLLIVGSLDHPVVQWNRETLAQLKCEKRLTLVEGATHLFPEPGALGIVADLAADWFVKHLTTRNAGL